MRLALAVSLVTLVACSDDPPPKDDFSIYKCKEKSSNVPFGNHNPGKDCGQCHQTGTAGAPVFTVAGTVFMSPTDMSPAVGANVTIRDGDLKIINMVTAENGNFYTMEQFKFPFRVWVSSCPDVELMPDYVDVNTGLGASCNQGICHNNAAGTGVITLYQ